MSKFSPAMQHKNNIQSMISILWAHFTNKIMSTEILISFNNMHHGPIVCFKKFWKRHQNVLVSMNPMK